MDFYSEFVHYPLFYPTNVSWLGFDIKASFANPSLDLILSPPPPKKKKKAREKLEFENDV